MLVLNNDTEATPGFLRVLDAAFEDPVVGVAGPRVVHADRPERIWYGGRSFRPGLGFRAPPGSARARRCGRRSGGSDRLGHRLRTRREGRRLAGTRGLDEDFYIYAEDVDFCLPGPRRRVVDRLRSRAPFSTMR